MQIYLRAFSLDRERKRKEEEKEETPKDEKRRVRSGNVTGYFLEGGKGTVKKQRAITG